MRMSSGAWREYEKPRSGWSTCIDERPRSMRIASARTPWSASRGRASAKLARMKRVSQTTSSARSENQAAASGSWSMAM
jgi:hypothetical protein